MVIYILGLLGQEQYDLNNIMTSEITTPPENHNGRNGRSDNGNYFVRAASGVTLLIKLGGLVFAGNEVLFVGPPYDPVVFGLAAFMMAGAVGIDTFINSFLKPGERK